MRFVSAVGEDEGAGMALVFQSEEELDSTIENLQKLRKFKAENKSEEYPAVYGIFPVGMDAFAGERLMKTFKETPVVKAGQSHESSQWV